jgi:5-methylcytosine-specific restriction endonuclease McrA
MGKRGPSPDNEVRTSALMLRLGGLSYAEIGQRLGLSRQRIQQILSPPAHVRREVVQKAKGKCSFCGLMVGMSGHVHHRRALGAAADDYNDMENLTLLCGSCHAVRHVVPEHAAKSVQKMILREQREKREQRERRHTGAGGG